MFTSRSARNAEFNVPQAWIEEAMAFVRRCWSEREGVFYYALEGDMGDVKTDAAWITARRDSVVVPGRSPFRSKWPGRPGNGCWPIHFGGFGETISE